MKKCITVLFGTLFYTTLLLAQATADTNTSVSFTRPESNQTNENEYGDKIMEQNVTITTKNFKINNYWGNYSDAAPNQSNFTNITTNAKVQLIISSTSACTLDTGLPEEGCSGQKPFLLNDEALISGTSDEFEVVFTEGTLYDNTDSHGFYPLDINRNAGYYQDINNTAGNNGSKKTFFSFITGAFDYIFSKTIGFGNNFFGKADIADVETDTRSDAAQDRRQRYIANIIAGVDKEHRMTKTFDGATATQIHPTINTPVSLLHYAEAKKTTTAEQCKFMFLSVSPDGIMCRMMSGFGMDAWMPFFNKTKTTEIKANYIMGDTENALLAMTGKIENVPYMKNVGEGDDEKLSFLQNILKPMKTMIGFMKNMMFGGSKASIVAKPVERVYSFSEDDAMTMTFAITNDGSVVDEFANFKLLKIRSVYGDEINSCRVKKTKRYFGVPVTDWKKTFVEGGSGKDGKSAEDWIDWCQESTGGNGMFDYLTNWSTGGVFNPINWMKGFFSAFWGTSYEILELKNTIGRGLILNLKKVDLNTTTKHTTTHFKIMNINRGNH